MCVGCVCSQCLRANTILPVLFPMLGKELQSPDWRVRFAALTAIAAVAESYPTGDESDYNTIMDQIAPFAKVRAGGVASAGGRVQRISLPVSSPTHAHRLTRLR